jgi:hypothetical protein
METQEFVNPYELGIGTMSANYLIMAKDHDGRTVSMKPVLSKIGNMILFGMYIRFQNPNQEGLGDFETFVNEIPWMKMSCFRCTTLFAMYLNKDDANTPEALLKILKDAQFFESLENIFKPLPRQWRVEEPFTQEMFVKLYKESLTKVFNLFSDYDKSSDTTPGFFINRYSTWGLDRTTLLTYHLSPVGVKESVYWGVSTGGDSNFDYTLETCFEENEDQ